MPHRKPFLQSSSLTKELRRTIFLIAIFFPFSVLLIYFSSQNFLDGLREINHTNTVMSLVSKVNESFLSSEESLSKLYTDSNIDAAHIAYTFNATQTYAKNFLEIINLEIKNIPNYKSHIDKLEQNINSYYQEANKVIPKISQYPIPRSVKIKESIKNDFLVAAQFSNDVTDLIRKEQLALKAYSDKIFTSVYSNRYKPILVAVVITIIFLSFVLFFGFTLSDKFSKSINNLNDATSSIAEGKLNFQAKIIFHDELGALTHAFNHMVNALSESRNALQKAFHHISRLQYITSSFSEAVSSEQIFNIIMDQSIESLGAHNALIAMVDPTNEYNLDIKMIKGESQLINSSINSIPLDYDIPLTRAIRLKKTIFITSIQQFHNEYAHLNQDNLNVLSRFPQLSIISFPLLVGSEIIGGLSLSFPENRIFDLHEKEFMQAVSQQCAQALHRTKLYESAKEAIAVRDEFLSIASHELKTPLTSLKLHMQRFARLVTKDKVQSLSLEDLTKTSRSANLQINRLTVQIDDLLDVSRISAGKFTLHFEIFNLAQVIQNVITEFGQQFPNIQKTTTLNLDPDINIKIDKIRIEQVLINLLSNATKYAPDSPIYITLAKMNSQWVKLVVKDNGPGINEHDQFRIFDRFERVKSTASVGGLGLGLYICKQIILTHNGKISVSSKKGFGAEFTIELPLFT